LVERNTEDTGEAEWVEYVTNTSPMLRVKELKNGLEKLTVNAHPHSFNKRRNRGKQGI
jgi:hypothetical protein